MKNEFFNIQYFHLSNMFLSKKGFTMNINQNEVSNKTNSILFAQIIIKYVEMMHFFFNFQVIQTFLTPSD